MEIAVLKSQPRTEIGKSANRKVRDGGLVPAVCYGRNREPLSLSVDPKDLFNLLRGERGLNTLIRLSGADDRLVFVQDFQRHPVQRDILHVDFLAVDENQPIKRNVPIEFIGRGEGVKEGGILQVVLREILVEALPANLPNKIEVDTSALKIGMSIHMQEVVMPAGVKPIFERNITLCTVVAPTEEKVAEPAVAAEGVVEGAEGAEGAVAAGAEGAAEGAAAAPAAAAAGDKKAPKKEEKSKDKSKDK